MCKTNNKNQFDEKFFNYLCEAFFGKDCEEYNDEYESIINETAVSYMPDINKILKQKGTMTVGEVAETCRKLAIKQYLLDALKYNDPDNHLFQFIQKNYPREIEKFIENS